MPVWRRSSAGRSSVTPPKKPSRGGGARRGARLGLAPRRPSAPQLVRVVAQPAFLLPPSGEGKGKGKEYLGLGLYRGFTVSASIAAMSSSQRKKSAKNLTRLLRLFVSKWGVI